MEDFKNQDQACEESFEEQMKEIEKQMVNKIFEYLNNDSFLGFKPSEIMNSYTIVQKLADQGDDKCIQLIYYYSKTIENYILECSKKLSSENNNFIEEFFHYTEKINILIYWMHKIFQYLDCYYTKKSKKATLSELAIYLYKSLFFEQFKKSILTELDKLKNEEKNDKIESSNLIKKINKLLDELEFKHPQIAKESNKIIWINKNDCPETNEDSKTKDFYEKIREFGEAKEKNDFQKMTNQSLINNPLKEKNEIDSFEKEESGNKNNLNKLIETKSKTLDTTISELEIYIKNKYIELITYGDLKNDFINFFVNLIKLKKEIDIYVKDHFDNNSLFFSIEEQTFCGLMKGDLISKRLSHYIDFCMRKGFKGKSQEEIDATLNDIISLFKCLNSKIAFLFETEKYMSKRLLENASLSILNEQNFISKLKQETGITYVSKMTGMMVDLEKNESNNKLYKNLEHKGSPNGIKFDVTVVSPSSWEIKNNSFEKFIIPRFLSTCIEDFEKFYLNRNNSHKLIWCLGLSKVEIQYLYLKNKNISVSTLPQLLTLLLLEEKGELSLEMISQLLGCQSSTVLNDIQGLVYNPSFNPYSSADKGIILGTFDEKTKEFKESDKICINKYFLCSKKKFNTLPISKKKLAELIKKEARDPEIMSRYENNILQATITRIMKSRIGQKTTHLRLVEETAKQVDLFKPLPEQIKENIEKLIFKHVIKRSEEDNSCYEYLA